MYNPIILAQAATSGLLMGFVYAMVSVGLTLIYSVMGLVNFAHGELLMLSMYFAYTAWKVFGIDPVFFVPINALIMFALGALLYRQVISRIIHAPRINQIFTTFAMIILFQSAAQFVWTADYKKVTNPILNGRVSVAGVFLSLPQVAAGVVALIAFLLMYWFIMKTRTGKAMRATAQDRQAASVMGIDTERMFLLAASLGIAAVAVAGTMLTNFYTIHPRAGVPFIAIAFVIVALGGFGSIMGAFVAAMLVGVIEGVVGVLLPPSVKQAVMFSIFMIVVGLRPKGLMGRR